MISKTKAMELLRLATKNPEAMFRAGQWEAIDSVSNKREKMLLVQRTGWGKSMVYFISAKALKDAGEGPALIVSPLLSLMRNQIEAAERIGVKAITINSTNSDNWPEIKRQVLDLNFDVLLISPERLANQDFVTNVLSPMAEGLGLLVIDEAHCISDWGHDFRPDYRRLAETIKRMPPNTPLLSTTATANDRVIDDIKSQMGDIRVARGELMRESLCLQTLRLDHQASRLAWLAEYIPQILDEMKELLGEHKAGIVYVLTKRDADRVTDWLCQHNINAKAYYAGAKSDVFPDTDSYRQHLEHLLQSNQIDVIVATVALGMGYDKPDLSFVIHYQSPGSVISYYQQIGRAGRAIPKAYAVIFSGAEDEDIHQYFRDQAFPKPEIVDQILGYLSNSNGLTKNELQGRVNIRPKKVEQSLKLLSVENPSPIIKDGAKYHRTTVRYQMDDERISRLTALRENEWQQMQKYIDSESCLMEFLANALDDQKACPCHRCSVCLHEPIIGTEVSEELEQEALLFMRQSEIVLQPRKLVHKGYLPIYGIAGYLGKQEFIAEEGRSLSKWGDVGWGKQVREDKYAGRFRDELVDAAVEMFEQRWVPSPSPSWVTCVPSKNHPDLVPDFAKRVAAQLQLPFEMCLTKVRSNQPQKIQENAFYQCQNLDGVFSVSGSIPRGPVLLIDDIVNSKWTFTVISALLRQQGASLVYPMALADTSRS